MLEWVMILVQATLAVLATVCCTRMVLPAFGRLHHPALVLDVWLPVALILPLMFLTLSVEGSVRGIGWFPIASPVMIALAAFGFAMLFGRLDATPVLPLRLMFASAFAGLLLLLLGAAHVLTIWIGQCAFALGAVLLWLNTPQDEAASPEHIPTRVQLRAGWGVAMVLLCAVGMGTSSLFVTVDVAALSGAMMLAMAVGIIVAATRVAGGDSALRIGLWAGTIGIFFGLGILSLVQLVPLSIRAYFGELRPGNDAVAFGFGAYAFEATLLMALAGLAWLVLPARKSVRQLAGGVALMVLAGFIIVRFAAII